MDLATEHMINK